MKILLHPTYFPSISHFVAMLQADQILFEAHDNFQKQTNRNRMYIYSANGKQLLNIPIKHNKQQTHQKYKDIRIEYDFDWQKQHFKSLEAAYRSSPYFEFFEDELAPIYTKKTTFLWDLNLEIHEFLSNALGITIPYQFTDEYHKEPAAELIDLRPLANGKKDTNQWDEYYQVFQEKEGYINNLSILDLLFNEGRNAVEYLKNQKLEL